MDGHDRSDQLERYWGGELSYDELPEGLMREEERLRELLGTLEEEVRAPSSLREGVMREVAATPTPVRPWRRLVDWFVTPRSVRVSPLGGTALALAASAVLVFVSSDAGSPTGEDRAGETADAVVTRFVFVAPEAESVHVTGDFMSWSPEGIALEDLRGTGIWTVDVPLPPGVHQYTFLVNGTEWRPDPLAVSQVDDGFGRVNSVVIVSGQGAV